MVVRVQIDAEDAGEQDAVSHLQPPQFHISDELVDNDLPANAGRGAESASHFLQAADAAAVGEALELRRRAAEQFLRSGHIDEGVKVLQGVLAAVGLKMPRTPRRALFSLLWRTVLLRLRGLRFRERKAEELAPGLLSQIDACWSAALGLSLVDPLCDLPVGGFEPARPRGRMIELAGEPRTIGAERVDLRKQCLVVAIEFAAPLGLAAILLAWRRA